MKKISVFLIILFALILPACQASGSSTKINVELSDFAITPNQFSLQAGSEATVRIINNGSVVHDLTIMKPGVDVGDQFSDEDRLNIYWQVEVQPGETATITLTAPSQPGLYQIVCGMPGHFESGMHGTLEVVE